MFNTKVFNDSRIADGSKKAEPIPTIVQFLNLVGTINLMAPAVKCTLKSVGIGTDGTWPYIGGFFFTPGGVLFGVLVQVDIIREDRAQRGIATRNLLGKKRKFRTIGNLIRFSHCTFTGCECFRNRTIPHIGGKDIRSS